MNTFSKYLIAAAFSIPSLARADVYDRIESCEQSNGANGCIFSLLRELAHSRPGSGGDRTVSYCQCISSPRSCDGNTEISGSGRLSVRLEVYTENTASGTVISSRDLVCYDDANRNSSVDATCRTELERNPRCNLSR